MYLEMLQQRYGAELEKQAMEKQAMEKQALNPMKLIQMGRRFAAKGKLDRFEQLIAKRNNVIKNTDVFAKRQKLADDLWRMVKKEEKWLRGADGPTLPTLPRWAHAYRRSPLIYSTKDLHRMLKNDPGKFLRYISDTQPSRAVNPAVLAEWSSKLH